MLLNNLRTTIAKEFLRDYTIQFTGSHIAKKNSLNQKSVANALNALEQEGFLKSTVSGKNKQFFLNLDDKEQVLQFIPIIEHVKAIEFYQKNPLVKEIVSKIKPFITGTALIFGSYAKGTQKQESDVDIFVAGSCNDKAIAEISKTYGIDISIKKYPSSIFDKLLSKKDILLTEVIKEHIIIVNADVFVSAVMSKYYGKN